MKQTNCHIDKFIKEPTVITWSRNYASLLGSFGFTVKKEGDYFDIYSEIIYRANKRGKKKICRIHKNEIVKFLINQGARLKLSKITKKVRNLTFNS